MAQVIKIKRSAVASKIPLTTDLALGELAMNTNDGKLFMKKNNGSDSIVEIGAETASNVGATGVGVFNQKTGSNFEFKKLVAGTNMTVTDNGTTVTLDAASGGGGANPANSIAPGVFIFTSQMNAGNTTTNGADAATTLTTNLPSGWSVSVASGVTTITHNVGRPPKSVNFWVGTTSTSNPLYVYVSGGNTAATGVVKMATSGTTALNTTTFQYQLVSTMATIANGFVQIVVTF
jgi:hypothetical protein